MCLSALVQLGGDTDDAYLPLELTLSLCWPPSKGPLASLSTGHPEPQPFGARFSTRLVGGHPLLKSVASVMDCKHCIASWC